MKITVCIGSSCHFKGSHQVVERLQDIIAQKNLGDKLELVGALCLGHCQEGVCVMLDEEVFSVTPDTVHAFFNHQVMERIG